MSFFVHLPLFNMPINMKLFNCFLITTLTFFSLNSGYAQNRIQRYLNGLKNNPDFSNCITGVMVMDERGRRVAGLNEDLPMLTASTMKSITTGVGISILGADFRFSTKIGYSGYIKDSVLYGDLYIIGGADPTLGSKDSIATDINSVFEKWMYFMKDAGIYQINGSIIADDRFFEPEIVPESWSWGNLGPYYGSGTSALSYNENTMDVILYSGKNRGDMSYLGEIKPTLPGLSLINEVVTSGADQGDNISYFTSDIAKSGVLKGHISTKKDSIITTISNKYPGITCAYQFKQYLKAQGIRSATEVKDARSIKAPAQSSLSVLGETYSPALKDIIYVTNHISNNFFAETILKMIGKSLTGVGSYDSSIVSLNRALEIMGVDKKGFTMVDGSGLSRQNYVSPRFFCNFFLKIKESNNFVPFYNSLPQPGSEGTLKSVLRDVELAKKQRIHAKSGSLSGVKCYAGYVDRGDGKFYTFAILTNNYSVKTAQIMKGIEGFMTVMLNNRR